MRTIAFGIFRRWTIRLALIWVAVVLVFQLAFVPIAIMVRLNARHHQELMDLVPGASVILKDYFEGNELTSPLIMSLSALCYALLIIAVVFDVRRQLKKKRRIATTLSGVERLRDAALDFHKREGRFPNSWAELEDGPQQEDGCDEKKPDVRFLSNLDVGIVATSAKPWRNPFGILRCAFVILEDGTIVKARGRAVTRLYDVISASSDHNSDVGRFYSSFGKLKFERGTGFASAFCPLRVLAVTPFFALPCLVLGKLSFDLFFYCVNHWNPFEIPEAFIYLSGILVSAPLTIGLILAAVLLLALCAYAGWLHWRAGAWERRNVAPLSSALVGALAACASFLWFFIVVLSGQNNAIFVARALLLHFTFPVFFVVSGWCCCFWYVLAAPFWGLLQLFS